MCVLTRQLCVPPHRRCVLTQEQHIRLLTQHLCLLTHHLCLLTQHPCMQSVVLPLLLRRTKETVDSAGHPIVVLPPVTVHTVRLVLTPPERDFYQVCGLRCAVCGLWSSVCGVRYAVCLPVLLDFLRFLSFSLSVSVSVSLLLFSHTFLSL